MGICDEVSQFKNGQEALDYVLESISDDKVLPDLVFIDRHMPILDGFEFVDALDKLESEKKNKIIVVLLSTLLSDPDTDAVHHYISKNSVLKACHKKPLTEELIKELAAEYLED